MAQLRWFTAGESHGPCLTVLIEGLPSGLALSADLISLDLSRRQRGYGRGGRMKIESDRAVITAGVRNGHSLGGPIALTIENRDFANWHGRMGAEVFETPPEPVSTPRPGHADLAAAIKYNRRDLRDVLERASARETAARVAAGAIARGLLSTIGVHVRSRVVSIGTVCDQHCLDLREWVTDGALGDQLEASSLRVLNADCEARMREEIHRASHDGDTLGGVIEVAAVGVPVGLGSHVHWDRKLDGRIAQAVLSVPAIKAFELGEGWASAALRGSAVHDPIRWSRDGFFRASNNAGGLEGGVTNGEPLWFRAAMKPISTLRKPLESVSVVTHTPSPATVERSDICAVPAAGVVLEAMLCLVLADALLEKFGGDSLDELTTRVTLWRKNARDW